MFDTLLNEKNHKELILSLRGITDELTKKKDEHIQEALRIQTVEIKGFSEAVRAIEIPAPVVNVKQEKTVIDISVIIESITAQTEKILKVLNEIKKELDKPMAEWEFTIKRNKDGFIESVTAKQII